MPVLPGLPVEIVGRPPDSDLEFFSVAPRRRSPMSPARAVAVSLLVLSAHAAVARAQMPGMPGNTRPINLVISGGMTVPAADLADLHDAGLHFDASLLLNIPGFPVALRPGVLVACFNLK